MSKYHQVVSVLQRAKDEVSSLLTGSEDQAHQLRISSSLEREITHLGLLTGVPVAAKAKTFGPATTIGGEKIKRQEKVAVKDLNPEEEQVKQLKEEATLAYDQFLTTDSKTIIKEFSDDVIRAVAKKAGLKDITKSNPQKLTVKFIESIKAAITEKQTATNTGDATGDTSTEANINTEPGSDDDDD